MAAALSPEVLTGEHVCCTTAIMSTTFIILKINQCQSGGHHDNWRNGQDLVRNDQYYLTRVGQAWAQERGLPFPPPPGTTYSLDKLPDGYAVFEKKRSTTGASHIDRYVCGHPNGDFRSLTEFRPHFHHLMVHGSAIGCACKVCKTPRRVARTASRRANLPPLSTAGQGGPSAQANTLFAPTVPLARGPQSTGSAASLLQGRIHSPPPQTSHTRVDGEGVVNVYDPLLGITSAPAREGVIPPAVQIEERSSPDWQTGTSMLTADLQEWKCLPPYHPRKGELVLFVPTFTVDQRLEWDQNQRTWMLKDPAQGILPARPRWEAGVVAQMPTSDVNGPGHVTRSGFRIEPLPEPGSADKSLSKQHRYIPLVAIRPLAYWKQCFHGIEEDDWPPTLRHALTVSQSFSVLNKYKVQASGDPRTGLQATISCRAAYFGPELIMLGDVIALLPNQPLQKPDSVTDAMIVTAIKICFKGAEPDAPIDWDENEPYDISLHVSGNGFTLDPARSCGGKGYHAVHPDSRLLPNKFAGYGQWYHMQHPENHKMKFEVPFTRVMGRCLPSSVLSDWGLVPAHVSPAAAFSAMEDSSHSGAIAHMSGELSQTLDGVRDARAFSYQHDTRIDKAASKHWFWADDRREQLDLTEFNGQPVGFKDKTRSKGQMARWVHALKVLDGQWADIRQRIPKYPEPSSSARYGPYNSVAPNGPFSARVPPPEKVELHGARSPEHAMAEESSPGFVTPSSYAVPDDKMDIDQDAIFPEDVPMPYMAEP